ncbi:hypothetical protein GJV77_11655 [Myroides pelagicus]|uniref:Tetratricopeptide repeat protein n=2 Tax=Myroides pelagicus TaxID=270914 RepID=A0A7K1GQ94_9FLAO|nr:tetratricopeptide repeat protein [Myroides pelagicus]MTH30553.1 hypothetical protein [Myroides pelagicus]
MNQSTDLTSCSIEELEGLLVRYPYFQSVRSILLKKLYQDNSKKYNSMLKTTAAYTLDREILFEYITTESFLQESFVQPIKAPLLSTNEEKEQKEIDNGISTNDIQEPKEEVTEATDNPIDSIEELENKLEIGSPLTISKNEKHSYEEWLKLTNYSPIDRENEPLLTEKEKNIEEKKKKNLTIIDRFIETNPKIVATKKGTLTPVNIETSTQENTNLMTETLAKIYLEQKKYQKAIQAYEILILKYPEKSSFFANQILDIKALQQYNS